MPPISFRLALVLPLLALNACGDKSSDANKSTVADQPTTASTEWVALNPTESAVPVELPNTRMTNVPPQPATPAPK
jgi:hypothetical protein